MQRSTLIPGGEARVTRIEINGPRLVPPLGRLGNLLLGHFCSACVATIGIKKGKGKGTNGFHRGDKLNTSTQSTPIDRILFDSGEDVCRVTNKRKGVCKQR